MEIRNYLEKSKRYKGFHYSVLTHEMLQYLHNKTLEMLRIIITIFEANNICYMICGGTLLGALTTGKFIPWDDDIDICVMENDYEKAINALIENVPVWMFVQCRKTEENYYHGWVKVRDKNSKIYPFETTYKCNGVWVDIYRLSREKRKKVKFLITKEHIDYLFRRYSGGGITLSEVFKRLSANKLISQFIKEKVKSIFSNDNSDIFVIWSASNILLEPEWCLPIRKYLFEGLRLFSFNNANAYLIEHYGDTYRELPSDEKRRIGINRVEIF